MISTGMQARMVALVGGLALVTGWFAATLVSPASQPAVPSRGGPRPIGRTDAPAPLTEELHTRLRALPRSPSSGRNPFVFAGRSHAAAAGVPPSTSAPAESGEVATRAAALPPPAARFQLSGIASSHVGDAIVLTAILTDNGALVLAKTGDRLAGGYQVTRVDETAVVLVNDAGTELTLRLK